MVYYSNESNELLETMSSDEQSDKECPLCMEVLEIDDINFYPCKCEYQICRFCWHRLRTDENGLCPACRQPYPEDPVNFQPLTSADVRKLKTEKKQKLQQQKNKTTESRKHLSAYRVLQKNLVYVVGLSQKMADPETLKKPEYFGRFGKIMKVAVGAPQHQTLACTAYVTYYSVESALKAIQAVNNAVVDSRMIKASLGTTKYCSNFLKGQPCHKQECMYLHELGDAEISFTKEDMQAGKHSEYEKKLLEQFFPNTSNEPKKRFHKNSLEKNAQKRERSIANGSINFDDSIDKKEPSEPPESGYSSCNNTDKCVLVENQTESREDDKSSNGSPSVSSSPPDKVDEIPIDIDSVISDERKSSTVLNGDDLLHNNEDHLSCVHNEHMRKTPFEHDDDLGFDPFSESSKALADLLEEEKTSYPYSEVKSSYPSMAQHHPFYQMGHGLENKSQQLPYPPGLGPSNLGFSSPETSFLQSLRSSSHPKLEPEHPGLLPFGGGFTQQHQTNNNILSGMSFLESLRMRQMENVFPPSQYQSSSFFNERPKYTENMDASRMASMLGAHLNHGMNDPFAATGSSSNAPFEHHAFHEPNFHGDISSNQHVQQRQPQAQDWRADFKALLGPNFGNVNVHFAADMDSVYHALSDGNNSLSGKHDPFYDNYGKTMKEPSLEQLFSSNTTIAPQFPPAPPGFSSQNHM